MPGRCEMQHRRLALCRIGLVELHIDEFILAFTQLVSFFDALLVRTQATAFANEAGRCQHQLAYRTITSLQ